MKLFDAHCHLEVSHFAADIDAVLQEAADNGIQYLVTCSTMSSEWLRSRELSEQFPQVYYAAGIHPWFVEREDISQVEQELPGILKGAVAVGEIGLDSKVDNPGMDKQLQFFELQLAMARDLGLPAVIHCRGAWNELLASVKKVGLRDAGAMIHSFGGSKQVAEAFIPLGFSFSLGALLTRASGKKRVDMLNTIYPAHFQLESDSPAMMPAGITGSRNEPSNMIHNCKAGARLINITPEELAQTAFNNSLAFFNLEHSHAG